MTDWDAIRYFLEVAGTQRASAAAQRLGHAALDSGGLDGGVEGAG